MQTDGEQAKEFYGASYAKAKDPEKLDKAFKQLRMAINASSDTVRDRALNLAADNENAAFAA